MLYALFVEHSVRISSTYATSLSLFLTTTINKQKLQFMQQILLMERLVTSSPIKVPRAQPQTTIYGPTAVEWQIQEKYAFRKLALGNEEASQYVPSDGHIN